jgi:serine/threonine protein kinase
MGSANSPGDLPSTSENLPPVSETPSVDVPAARSQSSARLPETIGPFKILGLLGTGGMGVVYRAWQEPLSREVALKVIKPGILSPEALARSRKEAEALARCQHNGIAHVYEADLIGAGNATQPYLVMELIDGQPLTDYADAQRLDLRGRMYLMIQVCEAVKLAHQKGVIHGDLKPANILVNREGPLPGGWQRPRASRPAPGAATPAGRSQQGAGWAGRQVGGRRPEGAAQAGRTSRPTPQPGQSLRPHSRTTPSGRDPGRFLDRFSRLSTAAAARRGSPATGLRCIVAPSPTTLHCTTLQCIAPRCSATMQRCNDRTSRSPDTPERSSWHFLARRPQQAARRQRGPAPGPGHRSTIRDGQFDTMT